MNDKFTEVEIDFPKYYDAVVGDTLELYAQGILRCRDYRNYYMVYHAPKGKAYRRKWSYKPMPGDEDFVLDLQVYNSARQLLAQKSVEIRVHQIPEKPERLLHVVCLGDSLTSSGEWPKELYRRLTQEACDGQKITCAGLGKESFRFVGTMKVTSPETGSVGYEGRGGWSWLTYTQAGAVQYWIHVTEGMKTDPASEQSIWKGEDGSLWQLETRDVSGSRLKMKLPPLQEASELCGPGSLTYVSGGGNTETIRYDNCEPESNNPFFDMKEGENDFIKYTKQLQVPAVDCFLCLLTWNGTKDLPEVLRQGKDFVDRLHAQYPDCKIVLMGLQIPNEDGMGESYGSSCIWGDDYWNYFYMENYVHELNHVYEAWCADPKYRDFLSFVQISGQFDTEYCGVFEERPANVRCEKTERVGINGVHPTPEGYRQIADAAFRKVIGMLDRKELC